MELEYLREPPDPWVTGEAWPQALDLTEEGDPGSNRTVLQPLRDLRLHSVGGLCLVPATFPAILLPYQEVLPYEGLRLAFLGVLAVVVVVILRWLHRLAPDLFPWWRLDDQPWVLSAM